MKKLLHSKPEPRSKLVAQAEKFLYEKFDLINSTAKVAGFRLPGGRELLLLRGGNSLRVLTKPIPTIPELAAPVLYPPGRSRNSNFASCAPTLGPAYAAAHWKLESFDQFNILLKGAAR